MKKITCTICGKKVSKEDHFIQKFLAKDKLERLYNLKRDFSICVECKREAMFANLINDIT